jgi:hypothetical protein
VTRAGRAEDGDPGSHHERAGPDVGRTAARPAPPPPRPARRADPAAGLEQWQDTEAALTRLYRYAEARAIDAIDCYLADKRGKRIWSRRLLLVVIPRAGCAP